MALVLVALALAVGASACGDDDATGGDATTTETTDQTSTQTTDEATTVDGRPVFLANCGSCHTFADAGTSGTIGPDLDGIGLSTDEVVEQVRRGGGGMPAFGDQLSEDEIEQVAAYVAGSRGT
jgi:mono/diheme cytochrome c family protein